MPDAPETPDTVPDAPPEPEHCHELGPFAFLMCEKPKGHKGKWHGCDLTVEHPPIVGGGTTHRLRWRVTRRVLGPRFN